MASGDTLVTWVAQDGVAKATGNAATFDTRNNHPVLDFDDAQDEEITFSAIMPRHYGGGGVTVYLHWSADGVAVNDVQWEVAFERIGDGQLDIDADSFATVQTVVDTAPGTDGFVTVASIAFTDGSQMDLVAVGELFRLLVGRDGLNNSTNDTMLADAELHAVEIKET